MQSTLHAPPKASNIPGMWTRGLGMATGLPLLGSIASRSRSREVKRSSHPYFPRYGTHRRNFHTPREEFPYSGGCHVPMGISFSRCAKFPHPHAVYGTHRVPHTEEQMPGSLLTSAYELLHRYMKNQWCYTLWKGGSISLRPDRLQINSHIHHSRLAVGSYHYIIHFPFVTN